MGSEWMIGLGGAFAGGLTTLFGSILMWPKIRAEAHKTNVQSDDLMVTRLWAEIERLDLDLREVRQELANVKSAAADEKTLLETDNKRLRYQVDSLRKRVAQLEEIIKTKTTPEDMRAQLAEIDRKTAAKTRDEGTAK